ncbi:MAG: hypothetical protein JWO80_4485 [Bryobacterales bacterium]|nr:hypothetical protein [Bryobacterales bacterium]
MRWRGYFRRASTDAELAREIQSYVDIETSDNIARGMDAREASDAAIRKFGNSTLIREEIYEMKSIVFIETFVQDVRYGVRTIFRGSPGFAFVAILALTLGIGLSTAMFSVFSTILLRPLPYRDSQSLVMVWENNRVRNHPTNVIAPADFLDWRTRNHVFEGMSAIAYYSDTLTGVGEPEQIAGHGVNANYLSLLGVQPILGRSFTVEEDRPGAAGVVVISHQFWMRNLGGQVSALGRQITLDGLPCTVIGILPPNFKSVGAAPDFLRPVRLNPAIDYRAKSGRGMRSIARLKPGVTLNQARAEMDDIARRLEAEHPKFNTGWGVTLVPIDDQITGAARPALFVLMGAVAFVLLIACANVANLLLARAAARDRELAVRVSLGAGTGRIVRQLLTESMILSGAGCLFGSLVAAWSVRSIRALAPRDIPRIDELSLDWHVLAFTAGIGLLAGILFGLAPAFHAVKSGLANKMRAGRGNSGSQRRAGSFFILIETALALMLLVGAGLMIRTLFHMQAVDPGFDAKRVLTMLVILNSSKYQEPARQVEFFERTVQELRRIPGVESAASIAGLPFAGLASATSFTVVGRPEPPPGQSPVTDVRVIHRDYFQTMHIPLLRGRNFDSRDDRPGAPRTFVISKELARSVFPNEDPIGKSLVVAMADTKPGEIVGITGDILHYALDGDVKPMVYYAMPQLPMSYASLVLRTAGGPMSFASQAIAAIHSIDRDQPVTEVEPMEQLLAGSIARTRYAMLLLAIFAGVAMLLAAAGIYGVTSYAVVRRTQEIGIRMALGAQRRNVLTMIMRQSMTPVVAGVAAGLCGALALRRLLASLLFGVGPADPATYTGVVAFLLAVAIAACMLPARRATKVNPVKALNYE